MSLESAWERLLDHFAGCEACEPGRPPEWLCRRGASLLALYESERAREAARRRRPRGADATRLWRARDAA